MGNWVLYALQSTCCLWNLADSAMALGSGSQWGFGGPMGGAPGLSTAQSRTNGGGISSFAQTIGSSQSHTPLDPS